MAALSGGSAEAAATGATPEIPVRPTRQLSLQRRPFRGIARGLPEAFTEEGREGFSPSRALGDDPACRLRERRGPGPQPRQDVLGPQFTAGLLVRGDQRGRDLGWPTCNVEQGDRILPADGVYAGWYVRPNGSRHACAINLGRRPTFYEHADHSLLEAHLIDFNDNLYGEQACVQFTNFLRSERKFDGIDALIGQLKNDIDHARTVLG
jgi:hypothetical protein